MRGREGGRELERKVEEESRERERARGRGGGGRERDIISMVSNSHDAFAYRHSAQVELKHKLKCLQGEHKSVKSALEVQCRESIKVSQVK